MNKVNFVGDDPINFMLISDTSTQDLVSHLQIMRNTTDRVENYLTAMRLLPLAIQATEPQYVINLEMDLVRLKGVNVAIVNELSKRSDKFVRNLFYLDIDEEELE